MTGEWDEVAADWLQWARTPGFDAYWYYRDEFFDSMVPLASCRTLEVGCGEGRVSRDLSARGHATTAVDSSMQLVRAAHAEHSSGRYLVAEGERLPFRAESFELVVAYNSLQVVADMHAAIAEISRVLEPGGHLCFCVVHPVTDLGEWREDASGRRLALRTNYFTTVRVEDEVERDGLRMTFRGWTYTLQDYANALADAGLRIEIISEPRPSDASRYGDWAAAPLFLNLRAVKL